MEDLCRSEWLCARMKDLGRGEKRVEVEMLRSGKLGPDKLLLRLICSGLQCFFGRFAENSFEMFGLFGPFQWLASSGFPYSGSFPRLRLVRLSSTSTSICTALALTFQWSP